MRIGNSMLVIINSQAKINKKIIKKKEKNIQEKLISN
jgi:hypothetical protein